MSSRLACSSVTRTVISFVMLAIGTRSSAFRASNDVARRRVLHEVGTASDLRSRGERRRGEREERCTAERSAASRRRCYLTRIRWPMRRAVGSMPGIEHDELGLREAEARRDHGERVARADAVEAAAPHRRSRRSWLRAAASAASELRSLVEARADEQDGDRHGGEERERRSVPRATPAPVYQPETAHTSSRSRAASAPAASASRPPRSGRHR